MGGIPGCEENFEAVVIKLGIFGMKLMVGGERVLSDVFDSNVVAGTIDILQGKIQVVVKMELERVKNDGNCLFNSVSLAMDGTVDKAVEMREAIAAIILADETKYTQKFLGQDPAEYCKWLTSGPHAWGGDTEFEILALHYGIEIGVVDIQQNFTFSFNEGSATGLRIYIAFTNDHFNLIRSWKGER